MSPAAPVCAAGHDAPAGSLRAALKALPSPRRGPGRSLFAAFALLGASWGTLGAPVSDSPEPRAAAEERFGRALSASRDAGEGLPTFLARWLSAAAEPEIVLLGTRTDFWTYGREPLLYRAFLVDSAFESRLDEVLPLLDAMLERAPALAAEAPWQALRARAQLRAGQPRRALASARRAWALDGRLCAADCAPLVRAWLQSGVVPAPSAWPALEIDQLYHPGRTGCREHPPKSLAWQIPEVEVVAATRGAQGQLAWLLRQGWKVHLAGCSNEPFGLMRQLDDRYPRIVVEQAWHGLQRSLRAGPGTSFDFLGVHLPLPAYECDFSVDANCRTGRRPLQPDSALALAEGLRAFSRHLAEPVQCPAPGTADGKGEAAGLRPRLRAQLEEVDAMEPAAARQVLRQVLEQAEWRPLWQSDIPYELSESLAKQARSEAPGEVLAMVQAFIDRAPDPLMRSDSAAELLALVLLRARKPQAALAQLELAQRRFPQLGRAQRIAQLRAGLAGADLDASLPVGIPPRPWVYQEGTSDSAVSQAWPARSDDDLDGVLVDDLVYALGGDRAVARRALKALWVPALLMWPDAKQELAIALKRGYAEPGAWESLLARALAGFTDAPEPRLVFDGVPLLLPDHSCVEHRCDVKAKVDAAWVEQELRALMR